MKLNLESIQQTQKWRSANITLPHYDIQAMKRTTAESPVWVHFGAGNIFRGFIAHLQHQLLNNGFARCGIVAVETFDLEIIERIYQPFDNLTLLVSLHPDGTTSREVVASVAESLRMGGDNAMEARRLTEIFTSPSLQMASFTITEKGYALYDMKGNLFPAVVSDMADGPVGARNTMSKVTALMLERYKAGAAPIALVSMDNCSHNGEKLSNSVWEIARAWERNGFVDAGFVAWLLDETKVSFPWSMIDKITPRPSEVVTNTLLADGIEDMGAIITKYNTYIAPFVNAEVPQYLVVEDHFPNGRPLLENAGVYMTDRNTVNNVERMKVTTCLNPLHTALAVYGCLLGYTSIAAEMTDKDLKRLVERIGYDEGMPVVVDPGILKPIDFIKEVIDSRLPNPFIPDAPQRIATDTSQKTAIRYGETIKSYIAHPLLDVTTLTYIPLAIAGWLRYLLGIDDAGNPMAVSSDPMLETLQQQMKGIEFGRLDSVENRLEPILRNPVLFGTDLVAAGLSGKIETMFKSLIAGPGAVRNTLTAYLK